MKNNQNQGPVIITLLLVIIVLLAAGGIYIYFSNSPATAPVATNTTNPSTPTSNTVPANTQTGAQAGASTAGMTQGVDNNFGFTFWYPNNWHVNQVPVTNPSKYPGGTIKEELDVTSGQRKITMEEVYSPSFSITDSTGVGACPVCSTVNYYLSGGPNNAWMVVYPNGASSGNPAATVPAHANISTNTMGGLHMLPGSQRFGANVIIPLSASNFLVVTVDGAIATGDSDPQALAKTIVATNGEVATPVSQAEQTQTIQEEANAYATIEGVSQN